MNHPEKLSLRILLTDGASVSARQTLYALGGRYTIDILDPNPLCQCRFSSHVRRWRKSPHFARQPDEWLRFLAAEIARERYDVVLPTHEQVVLLSRVRDQVGRATGLALPDFSAMEQMLNKAHFARLLGELKLPQPASTIIGTGAELDREWQFPLYVKLAHSTAGQGVFRVATAAELRTLASRLDRDGLLGGGREAVVQQPARGTQATAQGVFERGRLVAVHTFSALRLGVGGSSTVRVACDHPQVREHLAKLGRHLDWHGAMFLDYYATDDGEPQYLECNPRIGETVNAWLSGTNLAEQLVRVSLGEAVEPLPVAPPGRRSHSVLMILLAAAFEGAGRGELRQIRHEFGNRFDDDEMTRPHNDPWSRAPLWWTSLQLRIWPGIARRIVAATIRNYSLPEESLAAIRDLEPAAYNGVFAPRC